MADTKPRDYLYAIVFFVLIIVSVVVLIGEFQAVKPSYVNAEQLSEFNSSFNVQKEIVSKTEDLESNIVNADTDPGLFGVLNALLGSAWNSLRLMFSSFSFMDGVLEGFEKVFGIPSYIHLLVGTLITIMLVFSFLSALFQKEI